MSRTSPITACLALGSNLGDRRRAIDSALEHLDRRAGRIVRISRVIETRPVGPPGQGPYLNAAAAIETMLDPRGLLRVCLAIEREHGRDRTSGERWGPRTLDIDILLYGDAIVNEPGLAIPHPRLHERVFVLKPLAEIAGELLHPVLGVRIKLLLERAAPPAGQEAAAGIPARRDVLV
jgi:2-amino-4-hydroxy-6-hydroxymethyldihydropteridine diphosphokinase